jgi:hypothetical protein
VLSQVGGVLMVETVRKSGLDHAISAALAPWCKLRAVHDPGKVLLDIALETALGGDCLADVACVRSPKAVGSRFPKGARSRTDGWCSRNRTRAAPGLPGCTELEVSVPEVRAALLDLVVQLGQLLRQRGQTARARACL